MSNDTESLIGGVLALLVLAVIGVFFFRALYVDNECTKAGYRDSNVTWTFAAYCIKRVDQTDVVIPLDSARRRK